MKSIASIKEMVRSEGFLKYFRNILWLLFEKVGGMGLAFIVGAMVARYLGPENIGALNYAQSFVALFLVASDLGLGGIITRKLVNEPESEGIALGTGLTLRILGSILGLALICGILWLTPASEQTDYLVAIVAMGMLFSGFQVIDAFYQAKVLSKFVVRIRLIQLIVASVIKVILILVKAPLLWFAIVLLLNEGIIAIGYVWVYHLNRGSLRKWKFNKKMALELLGDSWPLILSSIMISIYLRVDQVMITNMLDEKANGFYSISLKFSEIWYFLPMILGSSLFPALLNAKKKSQEYYLNRMQDYFDFMVILGYGIVIFTLIAGPWLIVTIYGAEYALSGEIIVIHIFGVFFAFLGVAASEWLLAENLQRLDFYRTVLGAVANVGLNFFLIPRFGVKGAAYATVISQLLASYLGFLLVRKTWLMFFMLSKATTLYSPVLKAKKFLTTKSL